MQNQWYIARDGKQYGPVSDNDLAQLVRNKELIDGDYLWRHGFDNWLPAHQVQEVRELASNGAINPSLGAGPDIAEPGGFQQTQQDYLNSGDHGSDNRDQGLSPHSAVAQKEHYAVNNANGDGAANVDAHQPIDTQLGPQEAYAEPLGLDGADRTGDNRNLAARGAGINNDVQDLVEDHDLPISVAGAQDKNANSAHLQSAHLNSTHLKSTHLKSAHGNPAHENQGIQEQMDGALGSAYDMGAAQGGVSDGLAPQQTGYHANQSYLEGAHKAGQNSTLPPVKKSGFSWGLGLGIGVAALLILAVGATFALPFVVPPETIKKQISAAIKKQTGRDVSFKGKMSYRFFPNFGLDLNNIVVHNPPSIKGPDFVSIGRLQANLKLIPLLSKRVEVDRIILHRPEISLIDDGQGGTNYEIKSAALTRGLMGLVKTGNRVIRSFKIAQSETLDASDIIAQTLERLEREEAEKAKKGKTPDAEKAGEDTAGADPKGPTISQTPSSAKGDIQIGEIEIINGAVTLIDQKVNKETELNAINLIVKAPAADKDVTADGTVRFNEDRIALNGVFSTLGKLLKGEAVKTSFNANSERFESKFNGHIRIKNNIEFNGNTDVQTFSLQKLLGWFDVDVPRQGYGGAYIRGQLVGNKDNLVLKNATLKVDQTTLIGDIRMLPKGGSGGERPLIEAILKTDTLNLDPYLAQNKEIKRGALEGRKTAVAAWSTESFDVRFLKDFDGSIQLDAGRVIAMGHPFESAKVNAKLTSGLMNVALPSFKLYSGTGSLSLILNGAKPRPALKGRVALKKVQIQPLLTTAAGMKFISGAADLSLDITSAGTSQRAMISALNGTGKIAVADGALEGINIPGILRNLQRGQLTNLAKKSTEKTDFSELTGSFAIERGMLKNQDLKMKGPLLRMTGKGIVNLPMEQIDYGLAPKLVGSLRGQGGREDASGIQIPLRVKGPFSNPKILPDAKGLLSNNGEAITKTVKTVEKAVKKLKKKKISSEEMKNLLDGMIDGNGEGSNILDGILQ